MVKTKIGRDQVNMVFLSGMSMWTLKSISSPWKFRVHNILKEPLTMSTSWHKPRWLSKQTVNQSQWLDGIRTIMDASLTVTILCLTERFFSMYGSKLSDKSYLNT